MLRGCKTLPATARRSSSTRWTRMETTPLRILMLDTSSMRTGWLDCRLVAASDSCRTQVALLTRYSGVGPPLESSVGTAVFPSPRRPLTAVYGPRTGTCNQMAFAFDQSNRRQPRRGNPTCSAIRSLRIAASDRLDREKRVTETCCGHRDT